MKYLAVVSYLGNDFYGFQKNPGKRTVQAELERAITYLRGENTEIKSSGRTDKGVHAHGQVITFKIERKIEDLQRFLDSFNRLLPHDIAVRSLKEVPSFFHPRFACKQKTYIYKISLSLRDPLKFDTYFLQDKNFDLSLFKECLKLFIGKHNLHAFTTKEKDEEGYIRTIDDIKVKENKETLKIIFKGKSFMRYQIRFMVGASLKVAKGKLSLDNIERALSTGEALMNLNKAPAYGLTLWKVSYGKH